MSVKGVSPVNVRVCLPPLLQTVRLRLLFDKFSTRDGKKLITQDSFNALLTVRASQCVCEGVCVSAYGSYNMRVCLEDVGGG
jgi:hypothetical protein